MRPFWRRKKKEVIPREPITPGTHYFVKGKDVVFDLNSLAFTFEGFYVQITDEHLKIHIKDEVPMNLILVEGAAPTEVEFEFDTINDADSVKFTLQLDNELFSYLKEKLLAVHDIKEIFDITMGIKEDGGEEEVEKPLRVFSNYRIVMWGTHQILEDD